jgi:hypothetical protein
MWAVFKFAWRVISNLLQILIVLYVFSRLSARFEIIIVAILGLIYVTIRGVAFGIWYMLVNIAYGANNDFIFIRKHIGDDVTEREEEAKTAHGQATQTFYKNAIDGVALSIISLICLYQLFVVL